MISHSVTLRVRYAETDQMGVVYHANYLVYFEFGRTELIRSCGISYADLERQGIRLPVTDVEIRYFEPARYDNELTVHVQLTRMTPVRLVFEYELRRTDDQKLLAKARTTLASVSSQGSPSRLPEDFRALLTDGRRA